MERGELGSFDFSEGYLGQQKISVEILFAICCCSLHWTHLWWLKIFYRLVHLLTRPSWVVPDGYLLFQESYSLVDCH